MPIRTCDADFLSSSRREISAQRCAIADQRNLLEIVLYPAFTFSRTRSESWFSKTKRICWRSDGTSGSAHSAPEMARWLLDGTTSYFTRKAFTSLQNSMCPLYAVTITGIL